MSRTYQVLAWATLTLALALMPAFPEISSTIVIVVMVLSIPLLALDLRSDVRPVAGQWITLGGAALFALALVPTTRSVENYFVFLAVLPVALAVPLAALFRRLGPALTIERVSLLALAGTAIAAAITAFDVYVRGLSRGGYLTMNPIHIGDIAVLLGFVSLAAVLDTRRSTNPIYLLGPILALLAVLWSGSRGPLLAFCGLNVCSFIYFLWVRTPKRPLIAMVLVAVLAVVSGFLSLDRGVDQARVVAENYIEAAKGLPQDPGSDRADESLRAGSESVDGSTQIRLQLYEGAWKAFLDSPIYGHGGQDFVAAADARVDGPDISGWQHLHSDLADFAAIGGAMGLLSYLMFLVGPIIIGWQSRRARQVSLYVALASAGGVAAMGLTNAVIGILSLTIVYAVITAVLPAIHAGEHHIG